MNEALAAIYRQIEAYTPYNEEEAADKKAMLEFISRNDDALLRTNLTGHLTATAWVTDSSYCNYLMEFHNIYQSWSWIGGHADGDGNLTSVAAKELTEETGLTEAKLASPNIFSIEALHVEGHYKHGSYVPCHLHYNVTYLFTADPLWPVKIKPDENSGIRWFEANQLIKEVSETWMVEHVYKKLLAKTGS